MRTFTKRAAVIGAVSTIALGGGIAWAAWTTNGEGEAQAKAGEAQVLTVAASTEESTALYPGGTSPLKFTIDNPNPYAVSVSGVTAGAITSDKPGCNVESIQLVTPVTGLPLLVAADTEDQEFTLPSGVLMTGAANDDCQGATFTIPLTLTGESTAS